MSTTSIDELLMGGGGNSQQPDTTEYKDAQADIEEIEPDAVDTPEYDDEPEDDYTEDADEAEDEDDAPEEKRKKEYDEYGNEKDRMPKGMKDRLDRKDRAHQQEVEQRDREIEQLRSQLASRGASSEVQQAAKDFEYDPNESGDWQQQLASFVKQTVNSMTREQEEQQIRQRDHEAQQEFEGKFRQGMDKFQDFAQVIGGLGFQISNHMTLATRGMEDPAAFLYAAAKRNPQELERISKIRDHYAQMTEMGKLEERMRRNKPTTKAPRPLGRTAEDATAKPIKKEVDKSGDDLLAKADSKRLSTVKSRHRSNR
jgi:hypothetical protein